MIKRRNPIFDMMKGIGIILMLVGHMGFPSWVNQFIYSFHMPLFFFLSGYFSHYPNKISFGDSLKTNYSRLVLPYIVTMLFLIIWAILIGLIKNDYHLVIRHCLSLLWGSMDGIDSKWGYVDNCPMWFLLALFWGKVIWDQLSKLGDKAVIIAFCISVSSIIIDQWFKMVPWSFLQGLSSVMFIGIGWFFNHNEMPKWQIALCIFLWPVAIVFSHMEMASMTYCCLPLDILGSLGGVIVTYFFCKFLAVYSRHSFGIKAVLCLFGELSLTILCMSHFIGLSDIGNSIFIKIPNLQNRMWINVIETSFVFVLAIIVVRIPLLNRVYR